jgi:hypothetical protein
VQGHTAGFLGLQIALILLAIHNTVYILETGVCYDFLGGLKGTRITAHVYLVGNLGISAIKVYLTTYLVVLANYPEWAKGASGIPNKSVGQVIDVIWMIFNAVIPIVISYVRAKSERPLEVFVDLAPPRCSSGDATINA